MKALALFSGGLDSMLAIKLMSMQGIEVTAVNINFGFAGRTDTQDIMTRRAELAGADFVSIDAREAYLDEVLFSPKYGYGKHFNPCIDCHGFMFRTAKNLLKKYNADFMVTGEVIGQRPMSQRADAMRSVKKLAGDDENLILRPLSAKVMEPTKPELEGWVDREKLLGITGRGRDTQLALAKEFGWEDFQSPGGGCLLTDPNFALKLKEFIKFDKLEVGDINTLKNGRHLRLPDGAKLIIGRNAEENKFLEENIHDKFVRVKADNIPGPFALLSSNASPSDIELTAKIVLTFAKTKPQERYTVAIGEQKVESSPYKTREEAHKYFAI